MRKEVLILILLFSIEERGCAQWLKLYHGGMNETQWGIKDFQFVTSDLGYAGGKGGLLLKTTDRGKSWRFLSPGTTQELHSIYFVNEDVGFIAVRGSNQALKTIDGGLTWTTITIPTNVTFVDDGVKFIYFQDVNNGFLITDNEAIYKTTDSGNSWTNIYSFIAEPPVGSTFGARHLIGVSGTLYVAMYKYYNNGNPTTGGIAKSIDGGANWSLLETPYPVHDIYFIDNNNGIAIAGSLDSSPGFFYKTTNAGQTWVEQEWTGSLNYFNNIDFVKDSPNIGYIGGGGSLLKSVDGGATWNSITTPTSVNGKVAAVSSMDAFMVSTSSINKSNDGGLTWSSYKPNQLSLYAIDFVNTSNGYAVGDSVFCKIRDGGYTWEVTKAFTFSSRAVDFVSEMIGFVTGANGVITKTIDGGNNWITQTSGVSETLNDVFMVNEQAGFAVGNAGTILKTNNGDDWAILNSGTANNINSVFFITDQLGYAVGTSGLILKTVNGGDSWSQVTSNITNELFSIVFPSATVGYAGGANGKILKSTDGGDTWVSQTTNTSRTIYALAFVDEETGQAADAFLKTSDGGTTWVSSGTRPSTGPYRGIAMPQLNFVAAVGDNVAILPCNPVTISQHPTSQTLVQGSDLSLNVIASGTGALSFQWKKDNVIIAGATSSTYFKTNILTTDAGNYSVSISDACGTYSSNPAVVKILATEPANHITNLTFTNVTTTSYEVSFNAAAGSLSGYLVVRKKDSAPSGVPVDGQAYSIGNSITDGTVAYIGTSTAYTESGLDPGSTYHYIVFPYNGSHLSANYLTSSSSSNVGVAVTLPVAPTALTATNILYDNFTSRWDPVTGANFYRLDVSESIDFSSFVLSYQGKQIALLVETVNGLKVNTTYYYRVRAVNNGGESANSNIIEAKTQNVPPGTNPLQISLPTYSAFFPVDEQSQKVVVTLGDGIGAREAKLYYRGISANDFQSATATVSTTNANQFEATITRTMLDDLGLEFYVWAKDAAFMVTTTRYTVLKAYSGATSPLVPTPLHGGTLESYQIISIPLKLEDNLIQTIFGSVLGEYDDTKWRIVRYQNGGNVDFPVINKIELGKSYWFNSVEKVEIKAGVSSTTDANQTNPFKLLLSQGWNQIATPFPFAIDWDDILDANGNPIGIGKYKVYVPSSIGFTESNSLQPYSGGFVYADAAIDLNLPVTLKNTAGGRMGARQIGSDLSNDKWFVPISLTQGKAINPLGGIGMHPQAKAGKDDFDDITLPRFVKYLEFNSYHHEFVSPRFSRDVVPTGQQHSWEISIESDFEEGQVTLGWADSDLGNNEAQLILFDPVANILVDMKLIKSYSLSNSTNQNIKLIYFRERKIDIPGLLHLGRPFPNPGSDEINFQLFAITFSQARLEIFDMMGRRMHQSGYAITDNAINTIQWHCTDTTGQKVASGIYLFKLTTYSECKPKIYQGRIIIQ